MFAIIAVMAIAALSIVVACFTSDCSNVGFAARVVGFIAVAAVVIMLIICLIDVWTMDGDFEANVQRYESLTYQAEANLYDNDNDYGKKELANEIREWNEDLARYREKHDNPWISWFYPMDLEELDYIPVNLLR